MSIDIYEKHHIINLEGGQLSVYESGSSSNPPVLLLHGAMGDEARLIWHNLAPELSKSRHIFAVDFPRHGKSRPWTGFLGSARLIQTVDEVITYFALPPLPIIGLSMGGGAAIGYALKHPEKVSAAVLLAPGGLGDRVKMQLFTWLFIKAPGALKFLTSYYAKMSSSNMRKTLIKLLHNGEKSKDFDDLLAVISEEMKRKHEFRELSMDDWQLEGIAPFRLKLNYLPQLKDLKCPVLYLRGENDPLVEQCLMEEAARLTPNSKLCVINDAGHLLPLEQPEKVFEAITKFFEDNHI